MSDIADVKNKALIEALNTDKPASRDDKPMIEKLDGKIINCGCPKICSRCFCSCHNRASIKWSKLTIGEKHE